MHHDLLYRCQLDRNDLALLSIYTYNAQEAKVYYLFIKKLVSKLGRDERGTALMEYSMLLGVIAVAAIGAIVFAGDWVADQWAVLQSTLPQ